MAGGKGGGRGRGRGGGGGDAQANPPTSEVASAESNGINKEFLAEMASKYEKIINNEVFRELKDAGALGVVGGAADDDGDVETPPKRAKIGSKQSPAKMRSIHGMQSAFDLEEYKAAMKTHGTYRCAGNEFWLDFWFTPQPGVPYNKSSIYQLAENSFSTPNQWTGTNVVLVSDLTYNPMEHQGSLRRLSPEEVNFARVIGICNAIDRNADKDELEAFKVDIQCASFQFEYHEGGIDNPTHTAVRRSINLREQMRQTAKAVGRDTLQRIFEVLRIRRLMEQTSGKAVSNEALVQYYEKNISLSTESEAVTSTFIIQTSVVYNNILKDPKNLAILRSLSEKYGHNSPLNSITKLNTVLTKCEKQANMITWCLEMIRDVVDSGMVDVGEISNRALKDGAGGHKGLVDLFVIKKHLLSYLLRTDVDVRLRGSGSSKRRDEIVDMLSSHAKYRAKLNPIGTEPDLTFLAEYKDSEKMTIRSYENLIYGTEFDAQLRFCARTKKTPDEIVQVDLIKAELDRIDAQNALELAVENVRQSGDADGPPQHAAGAPPPPPPTAATATAAAAGSTPNAPLADDKVSLSSLLLPPSPPASPSPSPASLLLLLHLLILRLLPSHPSLLFSALSLPPSPSPTSFSPAPLLFRPLLLHLPLLPSSPPSLLSSSPPSASPSLTAGCNVDGDRSSPHR